MLADAETWERVLRKLSVRAMPPQNVPRPQEADYVGFTTWLANSLDSAWAAKGSQPGRYVVHWRVLSVESVVVEGSFTFRVAP